MTERSVILLVDRSRRNPALLAQFLGKAALSTACLTDVADALSHLETHSGSVALALIDISGFDAQIRSVCEHLRQTETPLLILSPRQSSSIQQRGLEFGAHAVLVKPLVALDLMKLVKSLMRTGL